MKLWQGAIPCLVLRGVVVLQIVEGEAPADRLTSYLSIYHARLQN